MDNKNQANKAKNSQVKVVTLQMLPIEEPSKKMRLFSFSNWVRVLQQNWRQGTVSCKGRSAIARSTKKPWKQKGTGRARAGSARSPLWRGGGVTFGPQPRIRTLKISKKSKKNVLKNMLFNLVDQGKFLSVDWQINGKNPLTSLAYELLKSSSLLDKKITVLLSAHDKLTYASFANISGVRLLYFDQLNAFDLANTDYLIVLKKDFDQFKGVVLS